MVLVWRRSYNLLISPAPPDSVDHLPVLSALYPKIIAHSTSFAKASQHSVNDQSALIPRFTIQILRPSMAVWGLFFAIAD
jgi:hypothetical protein